MVSSFRKFSIIRSSSPPSEWLKLRSKSQVLSKAMDSLLQLLQTTFERIWPAKKSQTTEFSLYLL